MEKDIPMTDGMRRFFERLMELKLFVKKRADERYQFYETDDELIASHTSLKEDFVKIYEELDELIKEEK